MEHTISSSWAINIQGPHHVAKKSTTRGTFLSPFTSSWTSWADIFSCPTKQEIHKPKIIFQASYRTLNPDLAKLKENLHTSPYPYRTSFQTSLFLSLSKISYTNQIKYLQKQTTHKTISIFMEQKHMNQKKNPQHKNCRKTAKFNGNGKKWISIVGKAYHKIVFSDMFAMRGSAKHLSWRCWEWRRRVLRKEWVLVMGFHGGERNRWWGLEW